MVTGAPKRNRSKAGSEITTSGADPLSAATPITATEEVVPVSTEAAAAPTVVQPSPATRGKRRATTAAPRRAATTRRASASRTPAQEQGAGAPRSKKPASPSKPKVEDQSAAPSVIEKSGKTKHAPKKQKLIRDSFTFPANDFALIAQIKKRALDSGREVKKSEVLRAGLMALAAMSSQNLHEVLDRVERIKTGRPAK